MSVRRGGRFVAGRLGALLLLMLLLSGCVKIQVLDATPAAGTSETQTSPLPAAEGEHNLAILAVDFDPPLERLNQIKPRPSVTLLVAVENIGQATERDVVVQAELTSAEDAKLLLSRRATLPAIAPGEIRVVRFPPLTNVPPHLSYHLEVKVVPAAGEASLDDNLKAFDIQIQPESPNP